MLHDIRAFFAERGVLEVETPALSQAANTDPAIESFPVDNAGGPLRYLHTSPEYPMKRLLAAGSGDIYQIARVWRQGESGTRHNPEFNLLEWYRVGFSYQQLIQEVDELLTSLFSSLPGALQKKSKIISYQQLFLEKFGFNPHTVNHADLAAAIDQHISGLDVNGLTDQAMLDALLTHCIEPQFDNKRLTFVIDYPADQSALAALKVNEEIKEKKEDKKDKKDKENNKGHLVAQRFEVYLGPLELGNGYQEETDYARNQQILARENRTRMQVVLHDQHDDQQQAKQAKMPEDQYFLAAIKAGLPRCAGVAIGLDRLLMLIANKKTLSQLINFSWDKA